ncbi:hypothetical protein L9F63_017329 [Diploptera punctata]|uniref:CHK kinase-like domain-containing protein n=1 Tax=Diploptera punctata TaxID=6984 RepID=A0AAD8EGH1_DIPPU|nr:hypothetical protein L9F63_017329 [Diploptera punctata]
MSSDDNKINVELKKEDVEKLLSQQLDNYGSTILDVEVFYYTHQNNDLQKLPIVAKLVPESPFLREAFSIEITFNKEVRAYTLVAPEFHKLQKEKGIPENEMLDVFPKYYGSRSNKQDDINMEADDSAVLLMENLKSSGYEVGDRRKGFNLEHMELVLSKLAKFHALGVALKLLKPQVFRDNILKTCEKFDIGNPDDDDSNEKFVNANINHVKHIPEVKPYLGKIEKDFRADMQMKKERRQYRIREPFSTIVHNDFWVNNMMFIYDKASTKTIGKKRSPIGIKFVDFQVTMHASPVRDLIFLLFSSSEHGLLEVYYERLIQLYHKEFVGLLTKVGCDTRGFSYEQFLKEINVVAPQEFIHILFMLNAICADPSGIEETSSMNQDSMLKSRGNKDFDKKVKCLIKMFVSQGWL